MVQEPTLEEVSKALLSQLHKCGSPSERAATTTKIYQHLDGIKNALDFLSESKPGAEVDAMRKRLMTCQTLLTEGIGAQEAVKTLLLKQQDDLDSFVIRSYLHLGSLENARQSPAERVRLDAASNMVRSFLGSTVLFRAKWKNQIACLKELYPEVTIDPYGSGLAALEKLPDALIPVEQRIKEALEAI